VVRPYMRPPRRKYAATCEIDSMFGPERRDDQVVPALVATRPALPTDFLAGADPGRPGCVSRVSGSTPPAESKKIHAKDSRTSRAVGCPSRMPLLRPTTFDHLRMPAALARGSRTRLAPVPDRAPAQDDRALVPVLARPEPQIPPVPTTLVDYLDDRADPTFWG